MLAYANQNMKGQGHWQQIGVLWAASAAPRFAERTALAPRAPTAWFCLHVDGTGLASQLNRWPRAGREGALERRAAAPPVRGAAAPPHPHSALERAVGIRSDAYRYLRLHLDFFGVLDTDSELAARS